VRRLVPLLLVLVTAAPQAAFAGEWFRCRYDGETRATCCCADRAEDACGAPRAEMRRAACCDVLRTEPTAMSARPEARGDARLGTALAQAALAPASIAAVAPAARESWAPASPRAAPPGLGRAIYLSHSSLLL